MSISSRWSRRRSFNPFHELKDLWHNKILTEPSHAALAHTIMSVRYRLPTQRSIYRRSARRCRPDDASAHITFRETKHLLTMWFLAPPCWQASPRQTELPHHSWMVDLHVHNWIVHKEIRLLLVSHQDMVCTVKTILASFRVLQYLAQRRLETHKEYYVSLLRHDTSRLSLTTHFDQRYLIMNRLHITKMPDLCRFAGYLHWSK